MNEANFDNEQRMHKNFGHYKRLERVPDEREQIFLDPLGNKQKTGKKGGFPGIARTVFAKNFEEKIRVDEFQQKRLKPSLAQQENQNRPATVAKEAENERQKVVFEQSTHDKNHHRLQRKHQRQSQHFDQENNEAGCFRVVLVEKEEIAVNENEGLLEGACADQKKVAHDGKKQNAAEDD